MRRAQPWFRKGRGWFVQVNGKQVFLADEREDAFQAYHELMAKPKEAKPSTDSVAVLIDTFLDWTQRHRPNSYKWYLDHLQAFVETVPSLTVGKLRPFHVQKYIDGKATWADGTKRGAIIAIKRAFNWAEKMGYIDRSPIRALEKPAAGTRETPILPEAFKAMLDAVKRQEHKDLLNLAWLSGGRPQELLRAEARHLDAANGRLIFPVKEAKGKRKVRVVYLPGDALVIATRLAKRYPKGKLLRNTDGKPWTPYAVNCMMRRIAKITGHSHALYDFRHGYATRMLQSGVDAVTVGVLMGHANPAMVATVYQHLAQNPKFMLDQAERAVG